MRTQDFGALVHGAGGDQNFGDEDLVVFELFADGVHTAQKALLQDLAGRNAFIQRLLHKFLYLGDTALLQCVTDII